MISLIITPYVSRKLGTGGTGEYSYANDVITDGTLTEFIWLVKNAEFVCTDYFHACMLSSIYEKEFDLLRRIHKAEDAKL